MNILFVHYGSFSSNSINHIGPFAAELKKQGHEVAIALPELDASFRYFPYHEVPVYSYEDILDNPNRFDGKPPEIIHAWTPREIVRQFVDKLRQFVSARCVIHLEDDEMAIRKPSDEATGSNLDRIDPLHGSWFMETADAFTIIIDSLKEDVPHSKPIHVLSPGFDTRSARSNPILPYTKKTFGIPEAFKIVAYPGAASGANSQDLTDLFLGIYILNTHGTPTILLKTGFPDLNLRKSLPDEALCWIRDVGFLERNQVWRLIELADLVIQPGRLNSYNEKRLPSKLPDFLSLGKPVITSRANLGKKLIDREQALILKESTAEEIAARCQELFSDAALSRKLATGGKEAAEEWFDLTKNAKGLASFYQQTAERGSGTTTKAPGSQLDSAIEALENTLEPIEKPSAETLRLVDYLKKVRDTDDSQRPLSKSSSQAQIEMQVYFPQAPELLELGSIRLWYTEQKRQSVTVPFTPPLDFEWLRIDPGQYPGTYILKSWSILDANRKPLFRWEPGKDNAVTCQVNGMTEGPITDDGQEFWGLTHDPQLLFAPLPKITVSDIRWLTIEFMATEIESPLNKPLKLRRRPSKREEAIEKRTNERIDALLATLERRQSFALRLADRFKKR